MGKHAGGGYHLALVIMVGIVLGGLAIGTYHFGNEDSAAAFGYFLGLVVLAGLLVIDRRDALKQRIGELEVALIDAGFEISWQKPKRTKLPRSPRISIAWRGGC